MPKKNCKKFPYCKKIPREENWEIILVVINDKSVIWKTIVYEGTKQRKNPMNYKLREWQIHQMDSKTGWKPHHTKIWVKTKEEGIYNMIELAGFTDGQKQPFL